MFLTSIALAAALSGAQPAPDTTASDLRCVALLAMQISALPDGDQKLQMVSGMMYFIGRIDGRTPGFDLEGGLVALVKSPPPDAEMQADQARCGQILMDRGTALVNMGNRIQKM